MALQPIPKEPKTSKYAMGRRSKVPALVRDALKKFGVKPDRMWSDIHPNIRTRKWVGGMDKLSDQKRQKIVEYVIQQLSNNNQRALDVEFSYHTRSVNQSYWSFRVKTVN